MMTLADAQAGQGPGRRRSYDAREIDCGQARRNGMTRYVIEPSVALALAERDARIPSQHRLFAPTLLRSQVLAELFARVQRGEMNKKEAGRRLDYLRSLQVRLLGDRVLQRVAWDFALELGWKDTFVAEYLALTRLQAEALVTTDKSLASTSSKLVAVATIEELLS
jgi:predicted nucleic acid-binding protein